MNLGLKDRVALVTGSTRGVGKVIAHTLANEGAEIIIHGRTENSMKKTLAEFSPESHASGLYFDADESSSTLKLNFSIVMALSKKIDILVNNLGGLGKFGNIMDLEDEDWERSLNLNLMSTVKFSRVAIPFLRKSTQGRIINICSLSGHSPGLNPHYSASKAAMLSFGKYLANFLSKDGILVNTICPGTLTDGGWFENIKDRAKRDNVSEEEAEKRIRQEGCAKVKSRNRRALAKLLKILS